MYITHYAEILMEKYIAQPYWPEANEVIDIQKKSGTNRARTDQKRAEALKAYLDRIEMPMERYKELMARAARPWYRIDPNDETSEIVIPRHQFSGAMVETCNRSPASVIKTGMADNLRTLVRVSDFATGKFTHDEKFERYVKSDQSNQRRFQSDVVLSDFTARGTLTFDPELLPFKNVEATLKYLLAQVGVGGARKMGYGRGKLIRLTATGVTMESPTDAPQKAPAQGEYAAVPAA